MSEETNTTSPRGTVTMPHVQIISGSTCRLARDWELRLELDDGTECHVKIGAGFVFDGASIPRALWRVCGHPLEAPRFVAALVHDWLYAAHVTTRAEADAIYRAILRAVGVAGWRCAIEYAALRLAGGAAWKSHGPEDRTAARLVGYIEFDNVKQ